jgi:hypothetical protein
MGSIKALSLIAVLVIGYVVPAATVRATIEAATMYSSQDVVDDVLTVLKASWEKRSADLSEGTTNFEIYDTNFIDTKRGKQDSTMTSLFGENTIAKQELNGIEIHLGPRGVDITDRYTIIDGPNADRLKDKFARLNVPFQPAYFGMPCGKAFPKSKSCEALIQQFVQHGFFDITQKMDFGPGIYVAETFNQAVKASARKGGIIFESFLYGGGLPSAPHVEPDDVLFFNTRFPSYVETPNALVVKDAPCLMPFAAFIVGPEDRVD